MNGRKRENCGYLYLYILCFFLFLFCPVFVHAAGINILQNPGFEAVTPLDNWESVGYSSHTSQTSIQKHSGSFSCVISSPTADFADAGVRSSTVTVAAGNKYTLRSWVFVAQSGGVIGDTEVRLQIEWYDVDGVFISSSGYSTGQYLSSFNGWECVEVSSVSAPSGAASAALVIDGRETQDNENSIFIDDAEIEDIAVGVPSVFSGAALSSSTIRWEWISVEGAEGYRVVSDTGGCISDDLEPDTTSWIEDSLVPNTIYYRHIEAYIGTETSSSSYAAVLTFAQAPLPPSIVSVSTNTIRLVLNTEQNPASTLYSIKALRSGTTYYLQQNGIFGASPVFYSTATWGNIETRGLQVNALYYFTANAKSLNGSETAYSDVVSTCTWAQVPGIAAFLFNEDKEIKVLIDSKANPHDTEYLTEISTDSTFSVLQSSSEWTTQDTWLFDGLTPNLAYYFRSASRNGCGIVTDYSTIYVQHTRAAMPQNIRCLAADNRSITAAWDANQNASGTLYELEISADNSDWSKCYSGELLQSTTDNLAAGTRYYFRARAKDMDGNYSAYSPEISTATLCNVPVAPSLLPLDGNTLQLAINADGNSELASYAIKVLLDGTTYYLSSNLEFLNPRYYIEPEYLTKEEWGNPIRLAGLERDKEYAFALSAKNSEGAVTDFSLWQGTATLVNAPQIAALNGLSDSAICIAWNGNQPWTEYRVESSVSDQFDAIVSSSGWITGSFYTFSDLTPFTSYYFRIKARNVRGVETAPISAGPKTVLPSDPVLEVLSGQVNGGKSNIPDVQLISTSTLHWNGFRYMWGTENRARDEVASNGTDWNGEALVVHCIDPGNQDGTRYFFQVVSLNPAGDRSSGMATFSVNFDTTPPRVMSVVAKSTACVDLTFNDTVVRVSTYAASSAVNPGNYAVDSLTISSATAYDQDGYSYYVFTDEQDPGKGYTLTVSTEITDDYGNHLDLNYSSATFTGYGVNYAPVVAYQAVPAQSTNGDGKVRILLNIYDENHQKCRAKIFYSTTSAEGPWSKAAIAMSEASCNDTEGEPAIDNNAEFQVGESTGQQIITYTPNTVNIIWDTHASLENGYFSTVYTSVTVNDYLTETSTGSAAFVVDNRHSANNVQAELGQLLDVTSTGLRWTAKPLSDESGIFYCFQGTGGSDWITESTYTFHGLTPNKKYSVQVRIRDGYGNENPISDSSSTYTYANPPQPNKFTYITAANIGILWGNNSNPDGTLYLVEVSSVSSGGVPLSTTGWTDDCFWNVGDLACNTTYFFSGKAKNDVGVLTDLIPLGSTVTASNIPSVPVITHINISSMTLSWSSLNPEGTTFELQQSANNSSNWTTIYAGQSSTWTASGLCPGTRYLYRVRSLSVRGVYSPYSGTANAYTRCDIPGNPRFASVSSNSITMEWLSSNNPDNTYYEVEESKDGFMWSVRAGVSTTTYSDTFSLYPNTQHLYRVRARSTNGYYTDYSSAMSTHTLASIPAQLSANAVLSNAIALSWTANDNASDTVYELGLSRDDALWTEIYRGTLLNFTTGGLRINTTYYFQVRAVNAENIPSDYCRLTAQTLALVPGAVGLISVSSTSIIVDIDESDNPDTTLYGINVSAGGTEYWVGDDKHLQSDAVYKSTSAWGALAVDGLIANRQYVFKARAQNHAGLFTDYSPSISTYTLAAQPLPGTYTVCADSIIVSWQANGNADPTRYIAENVFAITSSSTYNTNWTESGLTPNTTYSYRVKAVNCSGLETGWTPLNDVLTLAETPGALAVFEVWLTSMSVGLNTGRNPVETEYSIKISSSGWTGYLSPSGGFSDAAIYSSTVQWSSNGVIWMPGLSPNNPYTLAVSAKNRSGETTSYGQAITSSTLAQQVSEISITNVYVSSVTLSWESLNPWYTRYEVYCSKDGFALDISTPVKLSDNVTGTSVSVAELLPNSTCWFKIRSFNGDGIASDYSGIVSSVTCAAAPFYLPFQVYAETATIVWSSNDNPEGTQYSIANYNKGTSSTTYLTSWTETSLTPDTTYEYQIKASGLNGKDTVLVSTTIVTLANQPQIPSVNEIAVSSISIKVMPGNNNPGWTKYSILISSQHWTSFLRETGEFGETAVFSDTTTWGNPLWITRLTPNTTFVVSINALNSQSVPTGYTATGSVCTQALRPLADGMEVYTTSATIHWRDNGNPVGTQFVAENVTDLAAHSTNGLFWNDTPLQPNTTYQYRVKAVNHSGVSTAWETIGTTVTFAEIPPAPSVGEIAVTSVCVHINTGSNPWCTRYALRFRSGSTSSYISGTGGSTNDAVFQDTSTWGNTIWTKGLTTNTTYTIEVKAINSGGIETGFGQSTILRTLSTVPEEASITAVSISSITLSWSVEFHMAGDYYQITCSTDAFVSHCSTPVAFADHFEGTSRTVTSLTPDTRYWFRIESQTGSGNYSNIVSTITSLLPPAGTISWGSAGITSAAVTWIDTTDNPADTVYRFTLSLTDTFTGALYSADTVKSAGAASVAVLTPNTTYYGRISACGRGGIVRSTNLDPLSILLLSAPPADPAVQEVYLSSAIVAWNNNSNPSSTRYEVYLSTDDFAVNRSTPISLSSNHTSTTGIINDLLPDVTYWFRVRSFNSNGVPSAFSPSKALHVIPLSRRDSDGDGMNDELEIHIGADPHDKRDIEITNLYGYAVYTFDGDHNPNNGYEVYIDTTGLTVVVVRIDAEADGKFDYFIGHNGHGAPDKYWDPDDNGTSDVTIEDVDNDGTDDWVFHGYDKDKRMKKRVYNRALGLFLDYREITESKVYPCCPNPFNPCNGQPAAIVYDIAADGNATLEVYNMAGEKVAVLVNGFRKKGYHHIHWNGGNGSFDARDGQLVGGPNRLGSGIYVVVLQSDGNVRTTRIAIRK
jgi:hypothetical protein